MTVLYSMKRKENVYGNVAYRQKKLQSLHKRM